MSRMIYTTGGGVPAVWGTGVASTQQMRIIAANGVRMRLPYQLDWRLDTVLDSESYHIIGLGREGQDIDLDDSEVSPVDQDTWHEAVAHCHVYLKIVGVHDPFTMPLSVRFRDFLALEPAGREDQQGPGDSTRSTLTTLNLTTLVAPDDFTPESDGAVRARLAQQGRVSTRTTFGGPA